MTSQQPVNESLRLRQNYLATSTSGTIGIITTFFWTFGPVSTSCPTFRGAKNWLINALWHCLYKVINQRSEGSVLDYFNLFVSKLMTVCRMCCPCCFGRSCLIPNQVIINHFIRSILIMKSINVNWFTSSSLCDWPFVRALCNICFNRYRCATCFRLNSAIIGVLWIHLRYLRSSKV